MVGSLRQGHLLPMPTPAAILTGIGGVDLHELSASFCRFAGQLTEELRPRGICNALGKTMVVHHPVDGEVFHTDDTETINDLAALLMSEVIAFEGDTLLDTRNGFAMFLAFRCAFGQFRVFTLDFGKGFLFLPKETGVG